MKELELQRKSLPNEPGVYLFLDKAKTIIYVGKALNLKKRVNQYFLKSSYIDPYYEEKIKENLPIPKCTKADMYKAEKIICYLSY